MTSPGQLTAGIFNAVHNAVQGQKEKSSEKGHSEIVVVGQPLSTSAIGVPRVPMPDTVEVSKQGDEKKDPNPQPLGNVDQSAIFSGAGSRVPKSDDVLTMQKDGSVERPKDVKGETTPAVVSDPPKAPVKNGSGDALNSTSGKDQQGGEESKPPPPADKSKVKVENPPDKL